MYTYIRTYVHRRTFTNVAAVSVREPGGPRVGDPCFKLIIILWITRNPHGIDQGRSSVIYRI